jgi:hypothetical protein
MSAVGVLELPENLWLACGCGVANGADIPSKKHKAVIRKEYMLNRRVQHMRTDSEFVVGIILIYNLLT